jgi:hypothetical protein
MSRRIIPENAGEARVRIWMGAEDGNAEAREEERLRIVGAARDFGGRRVGWEGTTLMKERD